MTTDNNTTHTTSTQGLLEPLASTQTASTKAETSESDQSTVTIIGSIYAQLRRGIMPVDEKRELKLRIGGLLLEKREELKHGQFVPWVTQHMKFSVSTAYGLMKLKKLDSCPEAGASKKVQYCRPKRLPKWFLQLEEYWAIGQRQNKANQQPAKP